MEFIPFVDMLNKTQAYVAERYSASLNDPNKHDQVRGYIKQYIRNSGFGVNGYGVDALTDALYREMVEYSILTPYLGRDDVEEININGWKDVAVTFTDGSIHKVEHFFSPQHSIDVVRRLLQNSGMIIDDAKPIAQGNLPGNTRITALKDPLVDAECGMSASIRLLHPAKVDRTGLLMHNTLTTKMLDFLCMLVRYGVSFVVCGETSSGKTTLLNSILSTIPNDKRVYTIESGARELSLVRENENGEVVNNVVHTLSRPSDNPNNDITQEDLVVASLRFDPNVVVVGEMRDVEAYSAVEAALTGHTVVSTIHSFAGSAAHMRLALLCQKRFPIDFNLTLMQVAMAFPVVVFEKKLENNSRRVMDISECIVDQNGNREYRVLFRYVITKNEVENDVYDIEGHFEMVNEMSKELENKLVNSGAPQSLLSKFKMISADY